MEFLRESSHVIQRLICSTLDFDDIIVSLPQVIRISGGVFPNFALTRLKFATRNSDGSFLVEGKRWWFGRTVFQSHSKSAEMDQSTGKEDATSLFKVGIWSQLGSRYTNNCAEDEHLNGNVLTSYIYITRSRK